MSNRVDLSPMSHRGITKKIDGASYFSFLLFSSVCINFRNLKYDDGKVLGRSLLVYSTENESRRIAIGLSQDMDLADFHYFN